MRAKRVRSNGGCGIMNMSQYKDIKTKEQE